MPCRNILSVGSVTPWQTAPTVDIANTWKLLRCVSLLQFLITDEAPPALSKFVMEEQRWHVSKDYTRPVVALLKNESVTSVTLLKLEEPHFSLWLPCLVAALVLKEQHKVTSPAGKWLVSMVSPASCPLPTSSFWKEMSGIKLPHSQRGSLWELGSFVMWGTPRVWIPSLSAEKLWRRLFLKCQLDKVSLALRNILTQAFMFACRTWKALVMYNLSRAAPRWLKTFFT